MIDESVIYHIQILTNILDLKRSTIVLWYKDVLTVHTMLTFMPVIFNVNF